MHPVLPRSAFLLLTVAITLAANGAHAAWSAAPHSRPATKHVGAVDEFDEAALVSNEELSGMRGGFVTSNGLILDLGLATQTIVNGTIVEQTELSPEALRNVDPQTLRTLVRVNETTTTTSKLGLDDIPEIVTIIQNDSNNVKIDQITALNIDVKNVQSFTTQTQTPGLNFSAIMALR